ncbi:MAG: UDP-N-acetylglucosamine--N-acetylmuramyl-(pentapeptide) pyrophosphoryl-undecaprenol N-acetylglucosamine transferase [Myxococcales bacterium]|nr:UDP-N-acetylglucosamine--N-acetylmuramyl-(pentapeptide) pyrophosphoryl-undecaprenol N-acetylglucosamine transferase [Myxococcales bacterium]
MKVAFTGGGTGGHVYPNVPIIEAMRSRGYECIYIGQAASLEEQVMSKHGIQFRSIATTKLRRSFDYRNLFIPFLVISGFITSFSHLRDAQVKILFSKGGYVAVPVVLAAYILGIPVVIHESDRSPGLTTQISMRFAKVICTTLPARFLLGPLKGHKNVVHAGIPIRNIFFNIQEIQDPHLKNITRLNPYILIFGGSQGSRALNQLAEELAQIFADSYTVIRIAGKQKNALSPDLPKSNLHTLGIVQDDMAALIQGASHIVCRSGMTTLVEMAALGKRPILVPLPTAASRGDQLENAALVEELGDISVVHEGTNFATRIKEAINKELSLKDKVPKPLFGEVTIPFREETITNILIEHLGE